MKTHALESLFLEMLASQHPRCASANGPCLPHSPKLQIRLRRSIVAHFALMADARESAPPTRDERACVHYC